MLAAETQDLTASALAGDATTFTSNVRIRDFFGRYSGNIISYYCRRSGTIDRNRSYDSLSQILVREAASNEVTSLPASTTLAEFRSRLAQGGAEYDHHTFPMIAENGELLGMILSHDRVNPKLAATTRVGDIARRRWPVALEFYTLREASDLMVTAEVGCLPVVSADNSHKLVAVLSHRDLISADS